mmetsp:Transcript_53884/g.65046  ORF Transcript_53884/g.65046 Transcript_53884/m.65046 type:complete len:141 (-) Transcript_53884:204-626(-)|eukprot:CAMPEP_0172496688 /NCGR_PEP_ID=MMETSP1066-20121228/91394_1 /TAXON_ID=671091 /ORGANISM="Coscinodiscus wailesii, Strain CCMP2513" /LENGTH=140 /DNA_ID=CAMNT_0013269103 /DNA_START=75 /DNA_END=497 /DNA_ORIENTATION=+
MRHQSIFEYPFLIIIISTLLLQPAAASTAMYRRSTTSNIRQGSNRFYNTQPNTKKRKITSTTFAYRAKNKMKKSTADIGHADDSFEEILASLVPIGKTIAVSVKVGYKTAEPYVQTEMSSIPRALRSFKEIAERRLLSSQ